MIFNAEWRNQFHQFVLPWLSAAHPDLTRIAAKLRDVAVEVWTEAPSDSNKVVAAEVYSLEGWRVHFGRQHSRLNQWNTAHGAALQGYDSQAKTALDGFLSSIPIIGQAFNTIMAGYQDGSGNVVQVKVSQADRETLAAAIEAELQ